MLSVCARVRDVQMLNAGNIYMKFSDEHENLDMASDKLF